MILGAVSAATATFVGLYGVTSLARAKKGSSVSLIRATTLSPSEWQQHQRGLDSWYRRWFQPIAVLWGGRLRLRPVHLDQHYLTQCGFDPDAIDGVAFRAVKVAAAIAGGMIGAFLSVLLGSPPFLLPLMAWVGYVTPGRYLSRRRSKRQQIILRELPETVSMIRAFVAAGLPLERTLHLITADNRAPGVLKAEIRAALGRYGLGASIEEALCEIGGRTGADDVALLFSALAQSKRMGTSLEQTLRDQELLVQMNQRNRSTAEAARVGTKLLAVLAAVYLPEFVILIMVPLFWGIIQRAFG